MEIRIQCLCIDTTDPARIASFWESALGWRRTWEEEDQVCLEPPEGSPEDGIVPDLIFLKVPEGKTVKNRLHLDLRPADQSAEVARLEALGARQVSVGRFGHGSSRMGQLKNLLAQSWWLWIRDEYLPRCGGRERRAREAVRPGPAAGARRTRYHRGRP